MGKKAPGAGNKRQLTGCDVEGQEKRRNDEMWIKTSTYGRFASFSPQMATNVQLTETRTLGLPAMTSSIHCCIKMGREENKKRKFTFS